MSKQWQWCLSVQHSTCFIVTLGRYTIRSMASLGMRYELAGGVTNILMHRSSAFRIAESAESMPHGRSPRHLAAQNSRAPDISPAARLGAAPRRPSLLQCLANREKNRFKLWNKKHVVYKKNTLGFLSMGRTKR